MCKILMIVLGIFIFLGVFLIAGNMIYRQYTGAYSDQTYGFVVKDQRGWYSVPKKEGVYYLVGTKNASDPVENAKVVSTFSVIPVEKPTERDTEMTREVVEKSCRELALEQGGSTLKISDATLNHLDGYLCQFDAMATYVPKIYTLKQYFLYNSKGKYDFIVTVSYPKDNAVEEKKVEQIINGFGAR